jgi:hypothetical protein
MQAARTPLESIEKEKLGRACLPVGGLFFASPVGGLFLASPEPHGFKPAWSLLSRIC